MAKTPTPTAATTKAEPAAPLPERSGYRKYRIERGQYARKEKDGKPNAAGEKGGEFRHYGTGEGMPREVLLTDKEANLFGRARLTPLSDGGIILPN